MIPTKEEHMAANATTKKPEYSIRKKKQLARMVMVRKAKEVQRVRVSPRDDATRASLKHPRAGAFRSSGSNEWPLDTFTQRRLKDGSITLDESRESKSKASHSTSPATHVGSN
jgi:hypothetical protein